jgi:tripartite-type tricarboxylate transporter receptor subunit TctC
MTRSTILAITGTMLTFAGGQPAAAQDPLLAHCQYIRMIMPYTAGGNGDVGARVLVPYLSEELGIPVQIENLPGAGAQIGTTELVNAEPDGCTIGWTHLPATINTYLDPTRQAIFNRDSFAPIAMYVIDFGAIAVRSDSPYNTLADLIAAAEADPSAISISDSGVLSDGHLMLLELQRQTGADFAIVHSAGGAEGTADMLGGHTTGQSVNLSGTTVDLVESGQAKLLTLFTEEESDDFPGVTTATEQGFPIISSTSRAIAAPAGTPPEVVTALSEAVGRAVENPDFLAAAADISLPLAYMNAEETGAYWDQMAETVAPLVADYLATAQ